ncbi:MAG: hypothetical protein HY647_00425 [Acidobacteria bacterium]|nr:hypothetical protein [Acidobacteriota bacterium]
MEKEAQGWYRDQFAEMHAEIQHLLDLQIHYLDSDRTLETTSTRNIYDRFHDFRERIREEFPNEAQRIPTSMYETDEIGGLRKQDLRNLDRDIRVLEAIVQRRD